MGRTGLVLGAAGLALAASVAAGADRPDPALLRQTVAPAVCTVTVENTWGMPVAIANGFLLGDGRFVVSDLGAVAQPGVGSVTVRFEDGRLYVVRQFGLADVSLGLVALEVLADRAGKSGLPLAGTLPDLDGVTAVGMVGWEYAKDLGVATGRLWQGPSADDVASRARIQPPAGLDVFLRIAGSDLQAAAGAPVVDANGTVLAVHLSIAAPGIQVPLAVPAYSLRRSLLSAEPKLAMLTKLPRPVWPVETVRLAGEPPKPAGFQGARERIRDAMVCSQCRGRGRIRAEFDGGAMRTYDESIECPRCRGEGIALESGVYELLTTWAEKGTRAVWAPGPVGPVQTAARGAGRDMLRYLATIDRNFRAEFAQRAGRDVSQLGQMVPRGLIVYAEVRETIAGPDGEYVILDPVDTDGMVAVRLQDLLGKDGRGPSGLGRRPPDRAWVLLAGTVLSRLQAPGYVGVCVLPFEWTGCPTPGPVPQPKR